MKIVQVVNSMAFNQGFIHIIGNDLGQFQFLYRKKYFWSISKDGSGITLKFYPTITTLPTTTDIANAQLEGAVVTYRSYEMRDTEAIVTFNDFYNLLISRYHDLDSTFDEIINDLPF